MNLDKLQIYYGDLNSLGNKVSNYQCYLSPEEYTRAHKFRFDIDRNVYIQSHALLYRTLIERLKIQRKSLDIRFFDDKKPYIKDIGLDFNLTHSGEHFAYIIANDELTNVGVDIEVIKNFDINSILNHFFHKDEIEYVYSNKQDALIRFYEIWTRKEAYLKMLGYGITENLCQINVSSRIIDIGNYFELNDKREIRIYTHKTDSFVLSVAVTKPAELIYCKL